MPIQQRKTRTRQYRAAVAYKNPLFGSVSADVRYLKTVVNSEMSYFNFSNSSNFDATGAVHSMNNIIQGDTHNDRKGTSVMPRYQSVYLHINKQLAGPTHETFRVILFRYWGESSSQVPSVTIGEVLQKTDVLAFLNDDNAGKRGDRERRIEIHKSKLFTLDNVASTSRTYKWNIQVNGMNKKIKDHIKFRTNLTEQPISGGFYMLVLSTNATGNDKSSFSMNSKLNYYDN